MSSRFNIKNLKDLKNNRSKEFKSRLEKIKQGKFGDSDDEEDAESNLSSSIESQHKVEAYTKSLMGNQEYSVSDVDIDDIEDPREREIILLAKVRVLRDKLKFKTKLLKEMKKTLDSDEHVKTTMEKKLNELKNKLDAVKGSLISGKDNEGIGYDDTAGVNIKSRNLNTDYSKETIRKSEKMEYLSNSTALSKKHQIKIYLKEKESCMGSLIQYYILTKDFFTPFKDDIHKISLKYNDDVLVLFKIIRKLLIISIWVLIVLIYFFFLYITKLLDIYSNNTDEDLLCIYGIPCAALYSRIPESIIGSYSYSILFMTIVISYQGITFWLNYKQKLLNSQIYKKDSKKLSQFFFNLWSWSVNTENLYVQRRGQIQELLSTTVREFEIREKNSLFTSGDYCSKYILRILAFILEIIVLMVYSVAIIAVYILKNTMKSSDSVVDSFSIKYILYELIPPIAFLILSYIFPTSIAFLVRMEQWDYKITLINQTTIRYFIARAWGMIVVIFINVYFSVYGSTQTLIDLESIKIADLGCPGTSTLTDTIPTTASSIPTTIYANCNEDLIIIELLYIVLAEFVFTKLVDLIHYWLYYGFSRLRKLGKVWKPEVNPGKLVIDNLMLAFVLYIILPLSPLLVIIFPVIEFIQFKWTYYKVRKWRSKQQFITLQAATGYTLMIIFNISLFLIILFHCLLFIAKYPHDYFLGCYSDGTSGYYNYSTRQCGPFADKQTPSDYLISKIDAIAIIGDIYSILSSPLPWLIVLVYVISKLIYSDRENKGIEFYIKEKETDMQQEFSKISDEVSKFKSKTRLDQFESLNQ